MYRVNAPAVSAESFDGEVVVLNLRTGSYYSLQDTAAAVWDALDAGASPEAIVESFVGQFGEDRETVSTAVKRFVSQLLDEELIVTAEDVDASTPAPSPSVGGGQSPAFTEPVLQKYTDMEALLLLDPIHEVDEAGWPVTRPEAAQDQASG